MSRWVESLKHAFAIPAEADFAASAEELRVAEQVVGVIRNRGLVAPAILFLESVRPLNYVSAQSLHFFTPFVAALTDAGALETFARMLERPGSVEYLCRLLESQDGQM
jgi:hypothetical protein